MGYIVGINTAVVSLYLLYHFKASNKVVSTKIMSAHGAYHSVNRCERVDLRVRSNLSKGSEAGVPASNIRLIDRYEELTTGGLPKLKEEVRRAKVGILGGKS